MYVNFLESNPIFRQGKITSQNSEEFTRLWGELSQKLNSLGSGAIKTANQWKKVSITNMFCVLKETYINLYSTCVLDIYRMEKCGLEKKRETVNNFYFL